ncbi:MAG: DUF3343 domain-containing protein [bacterium]
MVDNEKYGIILFDTTQAAIKAERVLISEGISIKLIPVPRHISHNCGIAIRFSLDFVDKIRSVLRKEDVPIADIVLF